MQIRLSSCTGKTLTSPRCPQTWWNKMSKGHEEQKLVHQVFSHKLNRSEPSCSRTLTLGFPAAQSQTCAILPGLHAWFDLHHLVGDVDHTDGDLASLRVVLPFDVVIDSRLQIAPQLSLRKPWGKKIIEIRGKPLHSQRFCTGELKTFI